VAVVFSGRGRWRRRVGEGGQQDNVRATMAERLFTTYQVADLLGATPGAVVEWIQKGWLPIQRLPDGPVRISEKGLVQFLKACGVNIKEIMAKATEQDTQRRQRGQGRSDAAPAAEEPDLAVRAEPASEDEAILDQAEQAREVRRALLKSPGSEPPGEKPDEGRPIRQAVKEQAEEVVTSVEQEDEEGPVELLPEANAPAEAARQGEEGDLEQPAAQAEPVGLEVPSRQPPAPVGPAGAEALSAQAVLQRALQAGASHIHIDPGPEHWSLRMRVDGVLHAMFPAAAGQLDEAAPRLTEQIRALAKMRESAGRPQRARQAVELAGRSVPLRVVTTPTVFGEKMVIQFPEVSGLVPDLSEMGLEEPDAARLAACLAQPNGMILCCGWPRSGTSALLLAMASQLSRHGMSVATIERKAGVGIEGLVQSRIDETGLGFAELLDGFLDQDVEAVMIESLRDPATAKRALAAAEEGVKVLAGLGPASARPARPRRSPCWWRWDWSLGRFPVH